jgi:hypothetical protein
MKIEAGKYYRTRGGLIVGPICRYQYNSVYQFFFGEYIWTKEGKSTIGPDSPYDLIAQLTAHEAIPHVPPSDATPKVDRVVLASKILPRLAPDLTPPMAAKQALQYADAFLKEIENADS